jgi:cobalt-zinc-cadmium efflux system membrane fusion protein
VADNPDGKLKPGMFVNVELPNLDTDPVIQVAPEAVMNHEGRTFVFVQIGDEEFERRDIEIGRQGPKGIEVRSGLSSGERVAVAGGFSLKSRMLSELLAE